MTRVLPVPAPARIKTGPSVVSTAWRWAGFKETKLSMGGAQAATPCGPWPPLTRNKHGHAHGQAVGHLFKDDRTAAIGHFAVNFHAAVDRAGVHDQGVGLGPGQAGLGQAEQAGVFAEAGKHRLALALVLDAQEVDDVGVARWLPPRCR